MKSRLITVILWLFLASAADAQPAIELGIPLVEQRLGVLLESGSADDSEVVKAYKKVKDLLVQAESQNRDAANYVEAMTTAPQREAEIQARIDALQAHAEADKSLGKLTREELEARLVVTGTELSEARNSLDTLDRRLTARETNEVTLRNRLSQISSRIDSLPDDTLILPGSPHRPRRRIGASPPSISRCARSDAQSRRASPVSRCVSAPLLLKARNWL